MIKWLSISAAVTTGAVLVLTWQHIIWPVVKTRQLRKNYLGESGTNYGVVYLVGAGPGDPGLLTIKAKHLLSIATVAVVDDLVSDEIYQYIPRDCQVIYVGKRGGKKDSVKQSTIDQILVDKCKAGNLVVRLKGGDPMVFGRVHSEIRVLTQAGCKFEVVPGISSALAAPSVVNIPVTHKELSKSFHVISGHKPAEEWDFPWLAKVDTLLILMGTRTLPLICKQLIECGKSMDTPVALIHNGTLPTQVTLLGKLGDIAEKAKQKSYSPAIIVIGNVAKYADSTTYMNEN